jgi:branched-chain amino acid transport system substrate-binding protein
MSSRQTSAANRTSNRRQSPCDDAYVVAQGLVHVLKNCGNDLTRANVMKQAASIKDLEIAGLLPGITVNTSPTDFAPLSQLQLVKFKGETWERFGDIMSSDVGG